jgi:hypothetical protein
MRRPLKLLRSFVIACGLLLTLPVMGGAPSGQYDNFDGNAPTIRDRMTKLRWDRKTSGPMSFADAVANCVAPRRLPSMKELLSLIDEDPHFEYEGTQNVAKWIDGRAFGGDRTIAGAYYWTSSRDGANAFTVNFSDGTTRLDLVTDARHVRCVAPAP